MALHRAGRAHVADAVGRLADQRGALALGLALFLLPVAFTDGNPARLGSVTLAGRRQARHGKTGERADEQNERESGPVHGDLRLAAARTRQRSANAVKA